MQASTAIGLAALVFALLLAVPRHLVEPRVAAAVVGSVVLAFCGYETFFTLRDASSAQATVGASYLNTRDWVDQHLPDGATAAAILGEVYDVNTTPRAWWEAIFFNDQVPLPYYDLADAGEAWGQTAVQSLTVDERTGAVSGLGDARYVLRSTDDRRWPLEGAKTITQVGNFVLQTVPRAKRVPWTLRGTDQAGRLKPQGLAVLRVFAARAGRASLIVAGPTAGRRPVTLRIDDDGPARTVALAPGATRKITVRPRRRGRGGPPLVRLRAEGRRRDPGVQVMAVALG